MDLGFVAHGAESRVASATEGGRNHVLYQESLVLIQCGIDPSYLLDAVREIGLPTDEAEQVIRKAIAAYDPNRLVSVLTRAEAWIEAVTPVVHRRWHPMLNVIAQKAVEQNTTSPMIAQTGFPDVVGPPTVSRRLTALDQRGILHKKSRGRNEGKRLPNFYQLCMRRTSRFRNDCVCDRNL